MLVSLNIYDVTNTTNENTNGMITRLNSITRELNLGGVFHGAIQIEELEWSFGYCESGTGVYCCHARNNGMYSFREHLELGETSKTRQEIREIITRFKRSWPGTSYDLLQRNCCHFCEELCAALEVPRPPAWLNRFAQGADATVKFTNEASALARRVGSNLSITAQQSANWLRDLSQRVMSQISQTSADDADAGPGSFGASSNTTSASTAAATGQYPSTAFEGGPSRGPSQGGGHPIARSADSGFGSRGDLSSAGPRLASRLRALAGAGGAGASAGAAGGGVGASGLPPSSHASSSDLVSEQQRWQSQGQGQQGGGSSLSLPSVLKQKWQELEASAGDGTKQFLFGLIKTRQSKLDEDDMSFYGGSGSSDPGSGAAGGPPSSWSAPDLPRAGSRQGTIPAGSAADLPAVATAPIMAPPSQVIMHPSSLLGPDVGGWGASAPGSAAAARAATADAASGSAARTETRVSRQEAADGDAGAGDAGAEGAGLPAAPAADGLPAAAVVGAPAAVGSRPPPSGHLLDM